MPSPLVIPGSPGAQQEGLLRSALRQCVDLDPAVIYHITEEGIFTSLVLCQSLTPTTEVTRRLPSSSPPPLSIIQTQVEDLAIRAPDADTFLAELNCRIKRSLSHERLAHQMQATNQTRRAPLAPTNDNQAGIMLGLAEDGQTPGTEGLGGELTSVTAQTGLSSPTTRSVSTIQRSLRSQAPLEPNLDPGDSPSQTRRRPERKGKRDGDRRKPRARLTDQRADTQRDAYDLFSRMEEARAKIGH
jgi:hypothetical protein